MSKLFKELTQEDKLHIKELYMQADDPSSEMTRLKAQEQLSEKYGVTKRSIRSWAKELQIGVLAKNVVNGAKILIYDVETPRLRADVWWSGKQYVNGNDIIDEPKIITVAWKWFGGNKVYTAEWDDVDGVQCDKKLMITFLEAYNSADLVVGVNNNSFDNRWINARAMKHGLHVNMYVKSLDLQRQMKRIARLPTYALKYLCKFFGVTMKLSHSGIAMWNMVQYGTPAEKKKYMKEMIDYNIGDIISTEEVYVKMIPYMSHRAHLGVIAGSDKFSCPVCGEKDNLIYLGDTYTAAGTIQRLMKCGNDGAQYKISNREYLHWRSKEEDFNLKY
tara:strand:+ start:7292 stop:8287 length:996 start_codon:yes stop_codon:yes gene_type:complete